MRKRKQSLRTSRKARKPIKPASEDPKRIATGQIAPGHTLNPEGSNGVIEGLQRYGYRAEYLQETIPAIEIERLNQRKNRRELFATYSTRDVGIIRHIYAAHLAKEVNYKERDSLIDRTDGKATQRNELTGKDGRPLRPPQGALIFIGADDAEES